MRLLPAQKHSANGVSKSRAAFGTALVQKRGGDEKENLQNMERRGAVDDQIIKQQEGGPVESEVMRVR